MARPALSAVTELLKPITWFPPMWAFGCGVVASGVATEGRWRLIATGVLLAGPLVCASSQAVNDWFDREVDAINEPQRPIPSGRMPGRWGLGVAIGWTALSLLVACFLGPWGFAAGAVGLLLAWAYSAPPVRLKQNGWWGNAACGLCYEGLAWVTGAAVMAGGALPEARSLALAALYSVAAHGIMTLNDFKSVAGDRKLGIASLPVRLGIDRAARTACWVMAVPQFCVAALLLAWHQPAHAAAVVALVGGQLVLMRRFVARPVERALAYSGFGVPLLVLGMAVSAFALRGRHDAPGRSTGAGRPARRGAARMTRPAFGWLAVARLGLVQAGLGAVVVLTTSTLNRIMVVELALPALLPGALVAMHYLVQVLRPRMGFGSDLGQRRTPWIVGGMAVLAAGGVVAAAGTAWIGVERGAGIALAVLGFAAIGVGVSACGTSLLVLLAARVDPARRAGAATVVWLMMIVGFAVTAGVAGRLLDPYSPMRLVEVSAAVSVLAFAATLLATWRLEGAGGAASVRGVAVEALPPTSAEAGTAAALPKSSFREAVAQVWAEPVARRFTIFVFVSMLAYSAQDLILEPFAGSVFGYTPGRSTGLAGVQHGGVLVGMLAAALAGRGGRFGSLKAWQVGGCLLSGAMLAGLALSAFVGPAWPFQATVFALGVANGAFSIAAIASMMRLAGEGRQAREGVRMGLWGAAQAVAFGLGGLVGTGASDLARWWFGDPAPAYAAVFVFEAVLFVGAAVLAARLGHASSAPAPASSLSPSAPAPASPPAAPTATAGVRPPATPLPA